VQGLVNRLAYLDVFGDHLTLGKGSWQDKLVDYFDGVAGAIFRAMAPGGGVLKAAMQIAITGAPGAKVFATVAGTHRVIASGQLAEILGADTSQGCVAVPFLEGATQYVGVSVGSYPSLADVTLAGVRGFKHWTTCVGRTVTPSAVTDNGDGTVTLVLPLDAWTAAAAFRSVVAYLLTPTTSSSEAIYSGNAVLVGGAVHVVVSHQFGQTVASTTAADYVVFVKGPTVSGSGTVGTAIATIAADGSISYAAQVVLDDAGTTRLNLLQIARDLYFEDPAATLDNDGVANLAEPLRKLVLREQVMRESERNLWGGIAATPFSPGIWTGDNAEESRVFDPSEVVIDESGANWTVHAQWLTGISLFYGYVYTQGKFCRSATGLGDPALLAKSAASGTYVLIAVADEYLSGETPQYAARQILVPEATYNADYTDALRLANLLYTSTVQPTASDFAFVQGEAFAHGHVQSGAIRPGIAETGNALSAMDILRIAPSPTWGERWRMLDSVTTDLAVSNNGFEWILRLFQAGSSLSAIDATARFIGGIRKHLTTLGGYGDLLRVFGPGGNTDLGATELAGVLFGGDADLGVVARLRDVDVAGTPTSAEVLEVVRTGTPDPASPLARFAALGGHQADETETGKKACHFVPDVRLLGAAGKLVTRLLPICCGQATGFNEGTGSSTQPGWKTPIGSALSSALAVVTWEATVGRKMVSLRARVEAETDGPGITARVYDDATEITTAPVVWAPTESGWKDIAVTETEHQADHVYTIVFFAADGTFAGTSYVTGLSVAERLFELQ